MGISDKINSFKSNLPQGVTLVAVSKTKPSAMIREAYDSGHRIFGENRVQEMTDKAAELPDDIQWHAIGHLQRNKVKDIVPFVSMIHAVDSLRLLKEINKQAKKVDRVIPCLLQFHIAEESSKYGLSMEEATEILTGESFAVMENVSIQGVMGMATFTDNMEQVRNEFKTLKRIFDQLKAETFQDSEVFKEISMGMSGDYEIAIEEGSTMVRIGSTLFGARD